MPITPLYKDIVEFVAHTGMTYTPTMLVASIGVQDDLGSIEPGKLADLVIFEQNPRVDLRNTNTIQMVIKNGRLYNGNTLDEIWPRQRELIWAQWAADELLEDVPHRQVVFTIPKWLRPYFRDDRTSLGDLAACA